MESITIDDSSTTEEDDSVTDHTYQDNSSDSEIADTADHCEEELVCFSRNDDLLIKLCDWLQPVINSEDFLMSLVSLDCISFLALCHGFLHSNGRVRGILMNVYMNCLLIDLSLKFRMSNELILFVLFVIHNS